MWPKNPRSGSGKFQIRDLWNSNDCLKEMISLYFKHNGQVKLVAEELKIRRNTLLNVINQRMIPHLFKIWIEDCTGNVDAFAKALHIENIHQFQKTLRWHGRFEQYIASYPQAPEHHEALERIKRFFTPVKKRWLTRSPQSTTKQLPPPPIATSPSAKSDLEHETVTSPKEPIKERRIFRNTPNETDTFESISEKVTRLKTLKYGSLMIVGETGAGKGWLSRKVYEYLHPTHDKPYIHINCAHLISAAVELFGSVKGAYTDASEKKGAFELVREGGVIFLDEVDALSIPMQMKLLLILGEDRMFYRVGSTTPIYMEQFTLLTATNQNLEQLVQSGGFRRDLLGRINYPMIQMKPWHEQPRATKLFIINEILKNVIETEFETPFSKLIGNSFELSDEQIFNLVESDYTYNIRSVRKQIIDYLTQYLVQSHQEHLQTFKLQ